MYFVYLIYNWPNVSLLTQFIVWFAVFNNAGSVNCLVCRSSEGCTGCSRVYTEDVCWLESWSWQDHLFTLHLRNRFDVMFLMAILLATASYVVWVMTVSDVLAFSHKYFIFRNVVYFICYNGLTDTNKVSVCSTWVADLVIHLKICRRWCWRVLVLYAADTENIRFVFAAVKDTILQLNLKEYNLVWVGSAVIMQTSTCLPAILCDLQTAIAHRLSVR